MKLDETVRMGSNEACDKAGHLMMKYMDGELSERETEKLREHVAECASCKEDFLTYDFIRDGLSAEAGLLPPPEGFTQSVMRRVAELPSPRVEVAAAYEKKVKGLWGWLSVLFGVAFLLVWYREPIMGYLSGVPALSGYVAAITPATEWINQAVSGIAEGATNVFMMALGFVTDYKYVFFAAFCALCGFLFFMSRRRETDKSRNRA